MVEGRRNDGGWIARAMERLLCAACVCDVLAHVMVYSLDMLLSSNEFISGVMLRQMECLLLFHAWDSALCVVLQHL